MTQAMVFTIGSVIIGLIAFIMGVVYGIVHMKNKYKLWHTKRKND